MHPQAFQIGNFTVHWYGIMVALGFLVGLTLAARRGLSAGLRPEWILDLGVPLMIGTVIGARAMFVLTFWSEEFSRRPLWHIFAVWEGGLVFYGGLVGALLAGVGYTLWRRWPLWKLCDALAPSVALGFASGRIGCLLNGCCYGRVCEASWAIRFPSQHATLGAPVHPTQIYDALWAIALYAGLAWLYRRRKFDGQVFAVLLGAYAVLRSFVETFRGDYAQAHRFGPFTPAQIFSLGVVLVAVVLYTVLQRRSAAVTSTLPPPK